MRHKTRWIVGLIVGAIALVSTQTLWRDLGYDPPLDTPFAFEDSWGASAGTNGQHCLAPSFGYIRVVKADRVWVTLEDAGAYYWTWTEVGPCTQFVRTRHWVRANLEKQAEIEKRLKDFQKKERGDVDEESESEP